MPNQPPTPIPKPDAPDTIPEPDRRVERAVIRAYAEAGRGNIPMLVATRFDGVAIHEVWGIVSKQPGGPLYSVRLMHNQAGLTTSCVCESAQYGRPCWHQAAIRLAHHDLIPCEVATKFRIRPKNPVYGVTP